MSAWDVVGQAIEDILNQSGLPIGSGLRSIGHWFADDHPPAALSPPAPPGPPPPGMPGAPGGITDMLLPPEMRAPAPGGPPPAPPAAPPAGSDNPATPPPGTPPDGPSGQAAGAAAKDGQQVSASIEQLTELDKSAAATLDSIRAAGQAGRQQLDNIQHDVEAKIRELGPRLNTPQGQQELRDFLKDKLTAAKQVLDKAANDAEEQARRTRELTQQYAGVGGPDKPGKPCDPGGGSTPGGTSPAAAAPGATPAAGQPAAGPFGPGMMVPGGGGVPGFGGLPIPSFGGGGGVPGFGGGGDPLGGLGGFGPRGDTVGFDDPENRHHDDPGHHEHPETVGVTDQPDKKGSEPGTQPAGGAGGTEPGGEHAQDVSGGPAAHETGADVKLPDGTVAHARTDQGATAVRAALGGATVTDAYQQAGITVPPAGTPVTDPLPPTQLKAGDIGMWRDHMVMALGGGKVLVNGQVQPQDSLGSGPDFLGWVDVTKGHATPAASQPAPVTPAQS